VILPTDEAANYYSSSALQRSVAECISKFILPVTIIVEPDNLHADPFPVLG
jgi:hypothetical protein